MSAQVNKLLSPMKPVCNVVKTYSHILTTILFCVIVFTMIPFDLVVRSNIKNDTMRKLKSLLLMNPIGRIFMFLLFVCLYVNKDIMNMILYLYLIIALNATY
jgi:hypothetical protein